MEFDFSSDKPAKARRAPPARFTMQRTKKEEAAPVLPSQSKQSNSDSVSPIVLGNTDSPGHRRFIPTTPCRDGSIIYSKETALAAVDVMVEFNL